MRVDVSQVTSSGCYFDSANLSLSNSAKSSQDCLQGIPEARAGNLSGRVVERLRFSESVITSR
jgi:hypothetical protein